MTECAKEWSADSAQRVHRCFRAPDHDGHHLCRCGQSLATDDDLMQHYMEATARLRAESDLLRAAIKAFIEGPAESTAATVTYPVSAVARLMRQLDASGERASDG